MRKPTPFHPTRPPRPRLDVAVCYGTRPQVIKAARLVPALRDRWTVLTVDTGQHYDHALNQGLYGELGVDPPTVFLGVGAAHPVEQTARIAAACTQVLMSRRPRVAVVIGDTNSTLGCSVAARQLGIPLVHVEAGLRSGVIEMAEERNRIAVDAMSRVLCAPSPAAVRQLHREGLVGDVVFTGDVSLDVLAGSRDRAPARAAVSVLPEGPYAFATLHRAELTDDPVRLGGALRALGTLPMPVILSLHPRTDRRLREFGLSGAIPANVMATAPFSYLVNLTAIRHATVVVTDSGGVQREAYWFGTPCVTLRNETEWTETVECGANRLVPPDEAPTLLADAVVAATAVTSGWPRDAYGSAGAADRIAGAIATMIAPTRTSSRPFVNR